MWGADKGRGTDIAVGSRVDVLVARHRSSSAREDAIVETVDALAYGRP